MVRRSHVRASDADREYVAEQLRKAAGEGRLLAEELEHRLGAALSARTYGELDAVVSDLPREHAVGPARGRRSVQLRPATIVALAIVLPFAAALTIVLLVAVAALLTTWGIAIAVAALLLGPRARALRSSRYVGYRAYRGPYGYRVPRGRHPSPGRRDYRAAPGNFGPWL
jgi:hypothetical protein